MSWNYTPGGLPHFEELADGARCLAEALIVFDEGEADVTFSQRAKADAGRHRDLRLLQQLLREFERPDRPVALRQRRPHEHRSARRLHRPTRAFESRDQ